MKFSIIFVIAIVAMIGMVSPNVFGVSDNADAAIRVSINGDEYNFAESQYQEKSKDIRFENGNGDVIHRYDSTSTIGNLFESMGMEFTDICIQEIDGKWWCNSNVFNPETIWHLYVNGNEVSSLQDYVVEHNDRILMYYAEKDDGDIQLALSELELIEITKGESGISITETKSETKTNVDKVYTYAEIYAMTDQAGLDCDNKHGPPFGSMNQQFAYNECHNNVNAWESNQLDRTDYYGEPQRESSGGGGCLIATATYGSELAPQVQQLRDLRDNQLLQTESGAAFMGTFNDVYYSFSPIIADYERENPYFKEAVKIAITPMISSLSLMENANSESEVLGIGISVIMLNLGMYLGIPAIVIVGIRKRI